MPERRDKRSPWIAGGVGLAGLIAAGGVGWVAWNNGSSHEQPVAPVTAAVSPQRQVDHAGLDEIAEGIQKGDGLALAMLQKRLLVADDAVPLPAISSEESVVWQSILTSLMKGNSRYSAYGRANVVTLAGRIVEQYGVDPAPADWPATLVPFSEIAAAGLADTDIRVRMATLQQVARLWNWAPGRDMHPGQLDHVAAWKEGLLSLANRGLADASPEVRATAVATLAALSLDEQASNAIARLEDPSPAVRLQVLSSFAARRTLLDEEAIIPFLCDPQPGMASTAEKILKERGLTESQIGLAHMVSHPIEAMRLSAVDAVADRADIDSTLWLIYLSRDRSEAVRAKALEALSKSDRPEARKRLSEMAAQDPSDDIRQAAAKVAPSDAETTASLPTLPGSAALYPKAN